MRLVVVWQKLMPQGLNTFSPVQSYGRAGRRLKILWPFSAVSNVLNHFFPFVTHLSWISLGFVAVYPCTFLAQSVSKKKTRRNSSGSPFDRCLCYSLYVTCCWSLIVTFVDFVLFLFQPSDFTLLSARGTSSSCLLLLWGDGWDNVRVVFKSDWPGSQFSLCCDPPACRRKVTSGVSQQLGRVNLM